MAVISVTCIFGALLSGCHEHLYVERVVDPTCTSSGYTEYTCSCGANYIDEDSYTSKLEHVPVEVPAVAPSCMTDGRKEGVRCATCYAVLSGMEVEYSTIEHQMVDRNCIHCNKSAVNGFYYTYNRNTGEVAMTPIKSSTKIYGDVILTTLVRFKAISSQTFFPVTQIKSDAFSSGCTGITSLFVRENMREIGDGAFQYLKSLEKIAVEETNLYYADRQSILYNKDMTKIICFPQKHYLEELVLDDRVTEIGGYAFYGAKNLKKITIPSSVTRIGKNAFKDCTSLEYNEYEGGYYLGNDENPYLVLCQVKNRRSSEFTIHPNCKIIYDSAFKDCVNVESLVIPNGVLDIGSLAFGGCSSLVEITLPSSLENISESAFKNCIFLESISIPANVRSVGVGTFDGCIALHTISFSNGIEQLPEEVFKNCKKLVNFTIPSTVKKIGVRAFYSCLSLKELIVPEGTTSIGSYAFRNCTSLVKLSLPQSLVDLGKDLFSSCYDLEYNEYEKGFYLGNEANKYEILVSVEDSEMTTGIINENCRIIYAEAFKTCTMLKEISIPHNVISIGEAAFKYCKALQTITISDAVTSIGADMFTECQSLKSINVDSANPRFSSIDGVLYNKAQTILICVPRNITEITIPSTVLAVEDDAFNGCKNIEKATLPTSAFGLIAKSRLQIKEIIINGGDTLEQNIFDSCTNLERLILSEDITKIEKNALTGCVSLKYNEYQNGYYIGSPSNPYLALITVKDSNVTEFTVHPECRVIYQRALMNMNNLEEITISEGVLSIGERAFYGSDKLAKVNYNGQIDRWVEIDFVDSLSNPLSKAGRLFIGGVEVSEINLATSSIINPYAFYNCKSITKVTLGDNVASIGEYAFYEASNLAEIIISESVESIGQFAFSGCVKLQSIIVPDGVLEIGEKAFKGCTALQNATIGHGVTLYGNRVFADCESLTTITISNNTAEIGDFTFYYCEALVTINFNGSTVDWKAMKKGANWDYKTGEYIIVCTDGNIVKYE